MTNQEIISGNLILRGIEEDVNTYAGWKREGYQVQKGQKALFTTKIWKPCNYTDKATGEKGKKLFMVNASFFGVSQVSKN